MAEPTEPQKPVTDLSARAVSLARVIDRLPPGGCYVITLSKPGVKGLEWAVAISRTETIQEIFIGRHD
jgi:hypothetical protein